MRDGTHIDLSFWCKSRRFACTKRQVMSRTHSDLLCRSKSRCFASKNHTWGLGPIETSNSDASHPLLHAENHRWGLGPIEICNFGPKVAVMNAQNRRSGLEPIETSNSGANHAVMYAQNDRWDLVPIETCMLVQKSLFWMQKPQMRAGTNRDW